MLPAYSIGQHCVEVHAIISQYIIENTDSDEAYGLSPWGRLDTERLVGRGLSESFRRNSGVHDVFSLCARDYLQHKINKIEYDLLPEGLKNISMRTISDPHLIILTLQQAESSLFAIQGNALLIPSFQNETKSLIDDCHRILRSAHRLCRKLNQSIQRCLSEGNYKNLIEQIQLFCRSYPIATVAQRAATLFKDKVIPHCDGELLSYMTDLYESFQMLTRDCHITTLFTLPMIKLLIKYLQKCYSSLQAGSPNIENAHHYFTCGETNKELESIQADYFFQSQEFAPNYVQRETDKLLYN